MKEPKKREVNGLLKKILATDQAVTKNFVKYANSLMPFKSLNNHYKMLEISCHGVPWFAGWLAFMYLINSTTLIQMQINFLIGLFVDVICVAVIKAITRRRRPIPNDDDIFGKYGPDKFSFPSGHASRSVYVAYFFISLYPISFPFYLPFISWSIAVSLSRLLMYRHHILDVVAGIFLGLFNGLLIGLLWLGQDSCEWIYSLLSDEKLEGAQETTMHEFIRTFCICNIIRFSK